MKLFPYEFDESKSQLISSILICGPAVILFEFIIAVLFFILKIKIAGFIMIFFMINDLIIELYLRHRIIRITKGTWNPPVKTSDISFSKDFMSFMAKRLLGMKKGIMVPDETETEIEFFSLGDISSGDYVKWIPIDEKTWLIKKII